MSAPQTKVVGIESRTTEYGADYTIIIQRCVAGMTTREMLTRTARPDDLPGDIRAALHVWLAGNQP